MEVEIMSTATDGSPGDADADVPLPGFRFNPTDEELVSFYLRRKVAKKPMNPEVIKHADIYKHDPWDLVGCSKGKGMAEREWYFFCKRGRKYRNSIRPNRVTGSGFWKATGIDRPVTSASGGHIIGLKKSLVYYMGSAGKGTKTEWMMHEFRLPPPSASASKSSDDEAEVWTLCRLLRRSATRSKSLPEYKAPSSSSKISDVFDSKAVLQPDQCCSENSSIGSSDCRSRFINFCPESGSQCENEKPYSAQPALQFGKHQFWGQPSGGVLQPIPMLSSSCIEELLKHADWEDLISVVNYGNAMGNYLYPPGSS